MKVSVAVGRFTTVSKQVYNLTQKQLFILFSFSENDNCQWLFAVTAFLRKWVVLFFKYRSSQCLFSKDGSSMYFIHAHFSYLTQLPSLDSLSWKVNEINGYQLRRKNWNINRSGRMWFRKLWCLEINCKFEWMMTKTAVFPRNGHSWLRQRRYRVILI